MPAEASSPEEALRLADQRMYAHKACRLSASRQSSDVLLKVLSERNASCASTSAASPRLADADRRAARTPQHEVKRVALAAELHDIGKTAIPDAILYKPGPLDDQEWEFMRRHTVIGERTSCRARRSRPRPRSCAPATSASTAAATPTAQRRGDPARLPHHRGLRRLRRHDHPSAPTARAIDRSEALAELHRCAGTQFDPAVVEAFSRPRRRAHRRPRRRPPDAPRPDTVTGRGRLGREVLASDRQARRAPARGARRRLVPVRRRARAPRTASPSAPRCCRARPRSSARRVPRPTTRATWWRACGAPAARILLLGHLDTVVAHAAHRALERDGEKLVGSGAVDMKGGVVLALGVMRALAARPDAYAEVALLLVCDEEWRTAPFAHVERFAGFDACLCFEGGERTPDGEEGVVVRRKAAGTLRVAAGPRRALRRRSRPRAQRAARARRGRQAVAARHDPNGEHRLTAVPTVLNAGEAFNVVPGVGELFNDMRADAAFQRVLDAIPAEVGGATLHPEMMRLWPGMTRPRRRRRCSSAPRAALGRPVVGMPRGGASDASHFAASIPVTVDGSGRAAAPPTTLRSTSSPSRCRRARRWRSRSRARRSTDLVIASDSSSRGRNMTISSPRPPSTRTAATAPFLKSTRAPVSSWTTCENDGSWPTTSTRASASWRPSSSSASSRSKPLRARLSSGSTLSASHASRAVSARAHLRARVDRGELDAEPRQRAARRRGWRSPRAVSSRSASGLGVVRHGLAVPEEPELLGHGAERIRPRDCERRRGAHEGRTRKRTRRVMSPARSVSA